jgi:hypothetical protein
MGSPDGDRCEEDGAAGLDGHAGLAVPPLAGLPLDAGARPGRATVAQQFNPLRASQMLAEDVETCLAHGAIPSSFEAGRSMPPSAPQGFAEEDGEDPHGVALESCDISLRPLIAAMEQARGSRVVCIIHQPGMESSSVDTVTTEDVLTALQSTPADKPLDIILHTPGGYSYQAHQIALAVKAHRGRKTVFVPYFAMSGGTVISLAADEIVLGQHAVLGPIDTQFGVQHLQRMMPARAVIDLCATERQPHPRRTCGTGDRVQALCHAGPSGRAGADAGHVWPRNGGTDRPHA